MINANELRIGNLVKLENYFKIIGIMFRYGNDNYDIHVLRENSILIYKVLESELEPIPLTTEILEKCGFDWSIYHQAFHKLNLEFDLNESYPLGFSLCTFRNKLLVAPNIYFLHQLQNLYFALTGEELQINL